MNLSLRYVYHAFRVAHCNLRWWVSGVTRSSQWQALSKHTREAHPNCTACATTKRLQVHHIMPYHLFPKKELDPQNLIVLCMGPNECHIRIGHGDNYRVYNPKVVADAAEVLANPNQRDAIEARVKANRLDA